MLSKFAYVQNYYYLCSGKGMPTGTLNYKLTYLY